MRQQGNQVKKTNLRDGDAITITDYNILNSNIIGMHREIMEIRSDMMYGTRVKDPIVIGTTRFSFGKICLGLRRMRGGCLGE